MVLKKVLIPLEFMLIKKCWLLCSHRNFSNVGICLNYHISDCSKTIFRSVWIILKRLDSVEIHDSSVLEGMISNYRSK